MEEISVLTLIIGFGLFLVLTSTLQQFSKKTAFPYTVALLIVGLLSQLGLHFFGPFLEHNLELNLDITLSTDVIFFILLPILLFEGALNINFHQFRLQFKTITFLSTFALLTSIFVIGAGTTYSLGLPFGDALLFGAIISSTDPIAVLALFKTLGVPKRLALLADGESMFNDATGVLAFRIILGIVVGTQVVGEHAAEAATQATEQVSNWVIALNGVGSFVYMFVGSIVYGYIISTLVSKLIERIQNDKIIETTLTLALALFSFASAEHFLHMSGVIACVAAGISLGNFGRTKFSPGVEHFIHEFWEYLGFVSVSLVFFFAAYNLDVQALTHNPLQLLTVVLVVLIGRAVSVYLGFLVTNNIKFFKEEPNVPLAWQHILNWGGLRGVIPLVLVFTLPEDYVYRELFMSFTFACLLFTLFINGTTIKVLIIKLGLNKPEARDIIINQEQEIFEIEKARNRLKALADDLDEEIIKQQEAKLDELEKQHKTRLLETSNVQDLQQTLAIESIKIERDVLEELFTKGHIDEDVFHTFSAELDLQQDCLEYPEIYKGREWKEGIFVPAYRPMRKNFFDRAVIWSEKNPRLSKLFAINREVWVEQRFSLLNARVSTSNKVNEFLGDFEKLLADSPECLVTIRQIKAKHEALITKNKTEKQALREKYPQVVTRYQNRLVKLLALENSAELFNNVR